MLMHLYSRVCSQVLVDSIGLEACALFPVGTRGNTARPYGSRWRATLSELMTHAPLREGLRYPPVIRDLGLTHPGLIREFIPSGKIHLQYRVHTSSTYSHFPSNHVSDLVAAVQFKYALLSSSNCSINHLRKSG